MSDDEVRAICAKLLDEFRNELKDIKSDISYLEDDVTNLGDRVTALENASGPKVTGWVNYRIGFASSIDRNKETKDSAVAAEGGCGGNSWLNWWRGPVEVNSSLFDNVNQFDNLTAKIGAAGNINDDLAARVILKVRDTEPAQFMFHHEEVDMDQHAAEQVWLDEALLDFNWKWASARAVVGRQFQSYGLGLLVNNSRQSQQGVRMAWNSLGGSGLSLDAFVGGGTYSFGWEDEGLFGSEWPEWEGDGYISARLGYSSPNFAIAGNYLADGFGNERGWGGDLWAKFWGGRELQAEYATLTQSRNGYGFDNDDQPFAIMGNLDIWKGANWALKGYYSAAHYHWSTWYSTVSPYLEKYGEFDNGSFWVNWGRFLDNPLIIPNVRTIGGTLDVHAFNADWQAMYYNLDNFEGPENSSAWEHTMWSRWEPTRVPYNNIWGIRMKKQLADGVTLNLTYAQQLLNEDAEVNTWGPGDSYASDAGWDDVSILMAGISVGF